MDPIIAAIAANNGLIALSIFAALIGFLGLLYFYLAITGYTFYTRKTTTTVTDDVDDDEDDDVFIDTATVTHTGRNGEHLAESEETLWSALLMTQIIQRDAAKLNRFVDVTPVRQPDGVNDEIHFVVKDTDGAQTSQIILAGSEDFLNDLNRLMKKYPD